MNTLTKNLMEVQGRKHIVTTIEYDCPSEERQEEVFDCVRDILLENLDDFSKVTYDVDPSGQKVKVEISENRS